MLVISSTDDEFFMPDDDKYWWKNLLGEKHRLIVQNAEHALVTNIGLVLADIQVFFRSVIDKKDRPAFTWTVDRENAKIDVTEVNQHAVKA